MGFGSASAMIMLCSRSDVISDAVADGRKRQNVLRIMLGD